MPERTPRKPVTEMSASEIVAVLGTIDRQHLTAMLLYLSTVTPSAFEEALDRFGGSEH